MHTHMYIDVRFIVDVYQGLRKMSTTVSVDRASPNNEDNTGNEHTHRNSPQPKYKR